MMIRVNPMERLRAMLRWLAWSELLPVLRSEQVPRDIGKAEPFLETELRAAVPLSRRNAHSEPLTQAQALLSWLQHHYPPGTLLRATDVRDWWRSRASTATKNVGRQCAAWCRRGESRSAIQTRRRPGKPEHLQVRAWPRRWAAPVQCAQRAGYEKPSRQMRSGSRQ